VFERKLCGLITRYYLGFLKHLSGISEVESSESISGSLCLLEKLVSEALCDRWK